MQELLERAVYAAKEAGKAVMEEYAERGHTLKSDGSPVTEADIRANDVLISLLHDTRIPVLSEEMPGLLLPYPELLWIIDPLDGTRDFIDKTGDFAVMLGLVREGAPVLGVVYAPEKEKLYTGEIGKGAYLEHAGTKARLGVSSRTDELRCIRSRNHFTERMGAVIDTLGASTEAHGSIGVKAGLVAEDAGDFFFSWGNLGEWDVCAPEIILAEAGGRVTDVYGNALVYGNEKHRVEHGVVFSNGVSHERVLEAMRKAS